MSKEVTIIVGADTSKYDNAMANLKLTSKKTTGFVKRSWADIAGGIYTAKSAFDAYSKARDLAKFAAKADQERKAFTALAQSYGQNADYIVSKLREASAGTVHEIDLVNAAGKAMLLGIDPSKIDDLMKIARATARMTGQTITQAFEDIVTGSARQSKLILDNLGLMVSVGKANEEYAKKLGITVEAMTDAQKKTAFLNATLEAGEDKIKRLNVQGKTTAEMFQSMETFGTSVKVWLGKGFILVARTVVQAFAMAGATINDTLRAIVDLSIKALQVIDKIPGVDMTRTIRFAQGLSDHFRHAKEHAYDFVAEIDKLGKDPGPGRVQVRPDGIPATPASEQANKDALALKEASALAETELEQMAILHAMEWDEKQAELKRQKAQERLELKEATVNAEMELEQMAILHADEWDEKQAEKKKQRELSMAALRKKTAAGMVTDWKTALSEYGKHSRTAFESFKVVASAETVVKTYEAAQAAYAAMAGIPLVGPALGAAAAASAMAAGMARVNAIRNMSPSGGSSASSSGGGGGSAATPTYSADPTTGLPVYERTGAGAATSKTMTINIQGDVINDDTYIDNLVGRISDAVETRDVRLTATSSRTADTIN